MLYFPRNSRIFTHSGLKHCVFEKWHEVLVHAVQLSFTSELNYIFLSGYVDSQDTGLICCVVLLKGCVMILSLFLRQLQVSNATVAPTGHKVSSEQSFNRQTHELLTTTLTLLIEIRSLFRNNTYL